MADADLPRGFLPVVADLYDAALDPAKWRGLAPRIAHCFEGESCLIQARNPSAGAIEMLSATENFTPAMLRDYLAYYHRYDEWANRALPLPANKARLGQDLISHRDYSNAPIFEFGVRGGMIHLVGAILADEAAPLGLIGVHRDGREFDETSRRLMQLFVPHLQRSLQIARELAKEKLRGAVATEALDRLAVAALLVDGTARVLYANRPALALLREGDGLGEAGGRLAAQAPRAVERLSALIAAAAATGAGRSHHAGGQMQLPRRERRPLTALVSPMRPGHAGLTGAGGLALVFVRDPARPAAVDEAALQSLFGLTAAESRLAGALAAGLSLEDHAGERGLSVATVRTQLKQVMAKTQTNRQGELIATLLGTTASFR